MDKNNYYNDLAKIKIYSIEKINDIPQDLQNGILAIGFSYFDKGNDDFFGVVQFDFYWFHVRFEIHNSNFHIYSIITNTQVALFICQVHL